MILRLILVLLLSVVFTPHLGAAVFTVGPNGVYNSLQAAIDAAIGTGGEQEIRVEAGLYQENLNISPPFFGGSIMILGGWNDDFSARSPDAESTVVDGNQTGRPLTLEISGGAVLVDSITFSGGLVDGTLPFGGGIDAWLTGDAIIRVENCRIAENSIVSPSQAWGGGVSVWLQGTSELHLNRVFVLENTADCGSGAGGSGGLYIVASDSSIVTISSASIEGNTVQTSNLSALIQYGGIAVFGDDDSLVTIEDTQVRANSLEGSTNVWVSGAQLSGGQSLVVQRCRFIDNHAPLSDSVYQTFVNHGRLTDSIVAGGNANGLYLGSNNISIEATNLTVADAPGVGVSLNVGTNSSISLFNSAIFGNTVDLEVFPWSTGLLDMNFNLVGSNPGFVDPTNRDYHLLIGSPAENAGTNSPPGDLGPLDCDRGPRIIDSTVDIGAFEGISEVFTDGFESSTTQAWSYISPGDFQSPSMDALRTRFDSDADRHLYLTESFQADRDSRERGSRPLNSNR